MTGTQKYQLALYYMFAYADTQCTEEEKERLREIAKSYGASENEQWLIEGFVKQYIAEQSSPEDAVIRALGDMSTSFLSAARTTDSTETAFRQLVGSASHVSGTKERLYTVWSLVLLGYADGNYSPAEKKIINHISEKWEIKGSIVSIMRDTAETLAALDAKRNFIENLKQTQQFYTIADAENAAEKVNNSLEFIEAANKRLVNSVDLLIADAEI